MCPPSFKNRLLSPSHGFFRKIVQTYSCSSEVQFNDQSQSGDRDGEIAMKKLLLATVGLLALGMGAPASAADMAVKAAPPPIVAPIYSWAGFYIGANGGWGTSHKCWDVTNFLFPRATAIREGCHDADGGTVGGQIGYRWQASNWVLAAPPRTPIAATRHPAADRRIGLDEGALRRASALCPCAGHAPPRVEVFTFGTRLTRMTRALRLKNREQALAAAALTRRRLGRRHADRRCAGRLSRGAALRRLCARRAGAGAVGRARARRSGADDPRGRRISPRAPGGSTG